MQIYLFLLLVDLRVNSRENILQTNYLKFHFEVYLQFSLNPIAVDDFLVLKLTVSIDHQQHHSSIIGSNKHKVWLNTLEAKGYFHIYCTNSAT